MKSKIYLYQQNRINSGHLHEKNNHNTKQTIAKGKQDK